MIEAVGEGVDEGLELIEAFEQVVGLIELVSPEALGALDGAVELGSPGREQEEGETLLGAGLFELGGTARLRLPHMGLSARNLSTARTNAEGQAS